MQELKEGLTDREEPEPLMVHISINLLVMLRDK